MLLPASNADLYQKIAFVWTSSLKNRPYETGCHFGSVKHRNPGLRRDSRLSPAHHEPPGSAAPPFSRPAVPPRAQQRALPPAPGLRVARGGAGGAINPAGKNLNPRPPPSSPRPPVPAVGTRWHTYVVFLLWDVSARTRPTGWLLLSTHTTKWNLTADGCSPLDGGNGCLHASDPRLPSHSEGFPPLCQRAVQNKRFTSSVPCWIFKPKLESWERFHIRARLM